MNEINQDIKITANRVQNQILKNKINHRAKLKVKNERSKTKRWKEFGFQMPGVRITSDTRWYTVQWVFRVHLLR